MNWRLFLSWPLLIVAALFALVVFWPFSLFVNPREVTNAEGEKVAM